MKLISKKEKDLERKVANLQRDKKRLQSKLNRIKRLLRGVWGMNDAIKNEEQEQR